MTTTYDAWSVGTEVGWVASILLKSTLLLLAASLLAWSMRSASASARHVVWVLTLGALLALPLLSALLPHWTVPILPARPASEARYSEAPKPAPVSSTLGRPSTNEPLSRPSPHEPESSPRVVATSTTPPSGMRGGSSLPTLEWRAWALLAWSAGAALGLLQFLVGTASIHRVTSRAQSVEDEPWQRQLTEASRSLALRRKVEVRRTPAVVVPVVWGWRRPVILLPVDSAAWTEERRHAFLHHELAHVARHDCVAQTIACVAHALYWPHPLVWWAVRQLRREAERACDDRVLAAGTAAPEYAQYLLDAARSLHLAPRIPSHTSAVVERTHLGDRLLALLDDGLSRRSVTRRSVTLASVLVVVGAAGVAALQPAARAAAVKAARAVLSPVFPSEPAEGTKAASPGAVPRADPVLTGLVKGPDGKPVPNALVLAWKRFETYSFRPPAVARTDAKGVFHMPVPESTSYSLRVEAPSLAPGTGTATPGSPVTITLPKGGSLEGTVLDGGTRRAIAGARVTVVRGAGASMVSGAPVPFEPEAGRVSAVTDPNGRYRLEGLERGLNVVYAVAPGYGLAEARAATGASSVQLFLHPGAEIRGVVRDAGGKPVPRALVSADAESPTRAGAAAVATDDQGRFDLVGLGPGSYRLLVQHPQWAPSLLGGVVVEVGSGARVDVRLERAVRVVGRLVDVGERPVRGRVFLQALDGAEVPLLLAQQMSTDAGTDGRFTIPGAPTGTLTLGIRPTGYAPIQSEVTVGRDQTVADLGDVRLESGLVIRGTVQDRKGGPVANATVSTYGNARQANAVSDPDGSFMVAGLEAGAQQVSVSAEGFASAHVEAEAGGRPLTIVLGPEGVITGMVVDESARAVEQYRALARATGGRNGRAPTSVPKGGDGRFRLDGIEPGTYVLEIQAAAYVDKAVPDVKVSAGRTTDLGRVVLSSGGSIRGTVVDASSVPIPGADVRIEDSRGVLRSVRFGGTAEERRATTDLEGRFELRGLPDGPVPLKASHPQFAATDPVEVEVHSGSEPAATRITLFTGGRIEGAARSRDGRSFPGFVVVSGSWIQAPVQGDGTFGLDHVPTGHRTVSLMAGDAGQYDSVVTKEVEVREGGTSAVDLDVQDVLVSGRVTQGGKPLPRLQVRLSGAESVQMKMGMSTFAVPARSAGPQRMTAVTVADGSYDMIVSQPGRYSVWLSDLSRSKAASGTAAPGEVVVPDTEAFRYDITLPEWVLSGLVVDQGTRRSIPDATITAVESSGAPGGTSTRTGPNGRFRLALEPGEYRVRVDASRYAPTEINVPLDDTPTERTFELIQGSMLKGQVLTAGGQGIEGASVTALLADQPAKTARSLTGGSFELAGLPTGPYPLFAAHELGFALQAGLTPGDEPVVLRLTPGTRVRFHLNDPAGQPVVHTMLRIDLVRWNGTPVGVEQSAPYYLWVTTTGEGIVEMALPTGTVDVVAWATERRLRGEAHLAVEGAVLETTVTLAPPRK